MCGAHCHAVCAIRMRSLRPPGKRWGDEDSHVPDIFCMRTHWRCARSGRRYRVAAIWREEVGELRVVLIHVKHDSTHDAHTNATMHAPEINDREDGAYHHHHDDHNNNTDDEQEVMIHAQDGCVLCNKHTLEQELCYDDYVSVRHKEAARLRRGDVWQAVRQLRREWFVHLAHVRRRRARRWLWSPTNLSTNASGCIPSSDAAYHAHAWALLRRTWHVMCIQDGLDTRNGCGRRDADDLHRHMTHRLVCLVNERLWSHTFSCTTCYCSLLGTATADTTVKARLSRAPNVAAAQAWLRALVREHDVVHLLVEPHRRHRPRCQQGSRRGGVVHGRRYYHVSLIFATRSSRASSCVVVAQWVTNGRCCDCCGGEKAETAEDKRSVGVRESEELMLYRRRAGTDLVTSLNEVEQQLVTDYVRFAMSAMWVVSAIRGEE